MEGTNAERQVVEWLLEQSDDRLMGFLKGIQDILEQRRAEKRGNIPVTGQNVEKMEIGTKDNERKRKEKESEEKTEQKRIKQGEALIDGIKIQAQLPQKATRYGDVEKPKKIRRPPPIVVTQEGVFKSIKEMMKQAKIVPYEIKVVKEGTKVFTQDETDYRKMVKMLDGFEINYHT